MMPRKLPPRLSEAEQHAIRVLSARKTVAQIASMLGITKERVRRFCAAQGVTPQSGRYSPLADVDVPAEVRALGSMAAVARKYGVTRNAVSLRMQAQG